MIDEEPFVWGRCFEEFLTGFRWTLIRCFMKERRAVGFGIFSFLITGKKEPGICEGLEANKSC